MADPMTMMALVSTGLSIYSSINKGKQQQAANEAQARLYDMAADQRLYRAKINEGITREQGDRLIGDQIAAVGSSGRALSGSAFQLMYETAYQTSMEVLRNNEVAEYEAAQLRYKGQLSRFYGDQASKAGMIDAGSSLIDGAYKYSRTKSNPVDDSGPTGNSGSGSGNSNNPSGQPSLSASIYA